MNPLAASVVPSWRATGTWKLFRSHPSIVTAEEAQRGLLIRESRCGTAWKQPFCGVLWALQCLPSRLGADGKNLVNLGGPSSQLHIKFNDYIDNTAATMIFSKFRFSFRPNANLLTLGFAVQDDNHSKLCGSLHLHADTSARLHQ